MQTQKTVRAASAAAGALGGARQQKPPVQNRTPKEWYTLVVYERPSGRKTAVLYLGRRQTFTFKLPTDVKIDRLAVIIKTWRVGKTLAYSASIHVVNLAKLLNGCAREEAEKAGILEPILREAEEHVVRVAAYADGAQPEAQLQQTAPAKNICEKIRQVIEDLRNEDYLAIRIDELTELVNMKLRSGEGAAEVSINDVYECVRKDETIETMWKYPLPVVWLWSGSWIRVLISIISHEAHKRGHVKMQLFE